MYNFHKQKNQNNYQEYKNPQFSRDGYDNLKTIKRKVAINYKSTKRIAKKRKPL